MKKTYLKYFLAMFAIISILYLTACGGGGGGGNSVAPTPVAPSVRIIVDGSIFGDLASIRVSNRKIAENKQFSSEPFVKKEKLQNDRTSIKPIKGVEDKNEIKFGKISNFKNQKALLAEKKQIVNEAKKAKSAANFNKGLRPSVEAELKANLALPLIIKTTAYSNGKPVAGVVIDDRTATASGTNYVCDITGLNNSYDYRFAAYYNNKMLMQNQIASNEVNSGKNVNVNINTSYKVLAYEAWVETCSNGGTLASFTENCRKAGIDLNKEDSFASLSTISANDYIEALKKIVKGEEAVIPTSKEVDVSRIPVPAYNPTNQGENDTSIQPLNPVYLYSNIMDNIDFSAYSASDYSISYEDSCYLNNQGVSVPYYCLNPQFYMTYGLADISGTNVISNNAKEKITNAITVTNVTTNTVIDNSKISKLWNGEHLTVSFNEFLNANTEYLIAIPEFTFENYTISAYSFSFKTYKEQVINKKNRTLIKFGIDDNDNDIVYNKAYKLAPTFTMTYEPQDYLFSDLDKNKIFNAIHVVECNSNGEEIGKIEDNKVIKNWLNNALTIGFKENLKENSNYSIILNESDLIEPINFKPFFPYGFKFYTINSSKMIKATFTTVSGKMSDGRYSLTPTFNIKFPEGCYINNTDIMRNITNLKNNNTVSWYGSYSQSMNNIDFSCSKLEPDTEYRISVSSKISIYYNGKTYYLEPATFDFKTIPVIVATIVPCEDSVLAKGLSLKPNFNLKLEPDYNFPNGNGLPGFQYAKKGSDQKEWLHYQTNNGVALKDDKGAYVLFGSLNLPYDTEFTITSVDKSGEILFNDYTFKTIPNFEAVSYQIIPNEGSFISEETGDFYQLKPSFTIKYDQNYMFNSGVKKYAASGIKLKKINKVPVNDHISINDQYIESGYEYIDANFSRIWEGNNLIIELEDELEYDSIYEIELVEIDHKINNYGFHRVESEFRFITKKDISFNFTLTSNEGNVVEDNLYRLCPSFTVNFTSDQDITFPYRAISNAVSVKKISGELVTGYSLGTKKSNGRAIGMTIDFSSINNQLQGNTEYIISMSGINTIYGSSKITPFNDFIFKTIDKTSEISFSIPNGIQYNFEDCPVFCIRIDPYGLDFPRFGDILGLCSSISLKDMNTSEAIPLFYEGYGNSDKPYGYITNISFDNDGRYTGGYNPSSWFGIKVELKNLKSGHRYVFNNESKILGSYLLINGRLTSDFTVR